MLDGSTAGNTTGILKPHIDSKTKPVLCIFRRLYCESAQRRVWFSIDVVRFTPSFLSSAADMCLRRVDMNDLTHFW